jgi:hypothetical protein
MTGLVARPAWAATWLFILSIWVLCGASLLGTAVGQQALVDEHVRGVEAFGGRVSDDGYAALLAAPPWWVYFTSGGRLLLTPLVTVLVAAALWMIARFEGTAARFSQAIAVSVHASVVLLIGQLVATPLHYVRESLTSPFNVAAVLPLMEEGTAVARFFGTLDLFALWWSALLALGLAAMTKRRASRYALWFVVAFVVTAAAIAAIIEVRGGGS